MDLKIRLSCEDAETWVKYFMTTILEWDWEDQEVGQHHFRVICASVNDKELAQCALYKTRTLRVAYISAKDKYPNKYLE